MTALTAERIAAAMAITDEFTWTPWGFELDEPADVEALHVEDEAWVDAISERTQYVPLVEREAEVAA